MDKVLCTMLFVYLLLKKRNPALLTIGRMISRNRSAKLWQQLLSLFLVYMFFSLLGEKHTFGSQWLGLENVGME